jgi:hypothetical protein
MGIEADDDWNAHELKREVRGLNAKEQGRDGVEEEPP